MFNCTVQNIRSGNDIISVNSLKMKLIILNDFKFTNISDQKENIVASNLKSIEEIIFNNCIFSINNLNKSILISNDMTRINLNACKIKCYSTKNVVLISIHSEEITIENNKYTGNAPFGDFHGDIIFIKNCTFHDVNVSNVMLGLSAAFANIDNCTFRDIIGQSTTYGGLGLNTSDVIEFRISNTIFERVGTKSASGGIYIFTNKLKRFYCTNCSCIRCYSGSDDCGFKFSEYFQPTRDIKAYYQNNRFIECYVNVVESLDQSNVCVIRFATNSSYSYVEITNCTFVNPGLSTNDYYTQCAYFIDGDNFNIAGNTFLNATNSLFSIKSISKETPTKTYVSENHTFINITCPAYLMHFIQISNLELKNCYFKDIHSSIGRGIGLAVVNKIQLGVTFTNCTFINCYNSATSAIFATTGKNESFQMKDCYVDTANSFKDGAFMLINTNCSIINSVFKNCYSDKGGCFTCNFLSDFIVIDCIFDGNEAESLGGCIYFAQTSNKHNFKNLTARNNKAGISGAFIFFVNQVGFFDLDFFNGERNYALFGEIGFASIDAKLQQVTIVKMTNKSVGAIDIYNIVINHGSGSLAMDSVTKASINNFNVSTCNLSCGHIEMNHVNSISSIIKSNASENIRLNSMSIINTSNSMMDSKSININSCYFNYEKCDIHHPLIKLTQRNSILRINNSTFVANLDAFDTGELVYSEVRVSVFIENNCCFNLPKYKSFNLAEGSIIFAEDSVFGCFRLEMVEKEVTSKNIEFDLIGFIIIFISLIVLIVLISFYCIVTKRRLIEAIEIICPDNDKYSNENEISETTFNPKFSNNDIILTMPTIEIEDLCENDIPVFYHLYKE